jgi:hypothetical protein
MISWEIIIFIKVFILLINITLYMINSKQIETPTSRLKNMTDSVFSKNSDYMSISPHLQKMLK